jgi:hypothetical protein
MTAAEHHGDNRQRSNALPAVATDMRHWRLPEGLDFDSAAVQSRDNHASDQITSKQSEVDNSDGRQQRTELWKEHIVPALAVCTLLIVRDAGGRSNGKSP